VIYLEILRESQDLHNTFKDLTLHIRTIELWKTYISFQSDSSYIRKLYQTAFSIPMPEMNLLWQNYLAWETQEGFKNQTQDLYIKTYAQWTEEAPLHETLKLQLSENSNLVLNTLKTYESKFRDLMTYILEECVLHRPDSVDIWRDYLVLASKNKINYKKVSKRSVRNCFWDCDLWRNLMVAYERLGQPQKLQKVFGRAVSSELRELRGYYKLWEEYAFAQKRAGLDYVQTLIEGENWLQSYAYPTHLLLKCIRAEETQDQSLFEEVLKEEGSLYPLWKRYLQFASKHLSTETTRHIYKRAVEYIKDSTEKICNEYIDFETKNGSTELVYQSRLKVLKKLKRERKTFEHKQPPPKRVSMSKEERFTVYIRPVPTDLKEFQLQELLGQVVNVKSCRVVRDRKGKSRGFAFADLESQQDLEDCIKNFHNKKIKNVTMKVTPSKSSPSEAKDEFTVFMNNLPFSTTKKEVLECMEQFGNVSEVRIILDDQERCKGFAYVEFGDQESVKKALEATIVHIQNRKVLLRKCESKKDQKRTLHLSNLPFSLDETQIKDLFEGVTSVQLAKTPQGASKGFAFVEFDSEENAQKALEKETPVVKQRPIVVKPSSRSFKSSLQNQDFKNLL